MPVVSVFRRLMQEDFEFQGSLGRTARHLDGIPLCGAAS